MGTMKIVCIPYEKVSTILKPNLVYSGDHNDCTLSKLEKISIKNSVNIVGFVRGEPYWIEIIFPYSEDDTEKSEMIGKVNKILSTMRISMVLR